MRRKDKTSLEVQPYMRVASFPGERIFRAFYEFKGHVSTLRDVPGVLRERACAREKGRGGSSGSDL